MSLQSFQELITYQSVAGTSFGTYTTAKTVIQPTNLVQFPPNYFYIGKTLRTRVYGSIGTLVTTPGTIVFQQMIGGAVAWTSGNIQLNATAHTTIPFSLDLLWTCRAVGSGTGANGIGHATLNGIMFTLTAAQTDQVNNGTTLIVPAVAPAVGSGIDSTLATLLDFWVGFSISNAANTIQLSQYIVEALN